MKSKIMTLGFRRECAIRAVRSWCREHNLPLTMTADDALMVLNDMCRHYGASSNYYWYLWYMIASVDSGAQIRLFGREWRKSQKER